MTDSESVLELDDEDRHHDDEPELMSDDEFLADIQDIFEDADDSLEAFGSPSFETEETDAQSEETNRKNLEEELQSELEGWTDDEGTDNDSSGGQPESNFDKLKESSTEEKNPLPPKRQGVKKTASDSIDLKAELLDFEDEIRAGSEQTEAPPEFQETADFDTLRNEVESLGEARNTLNDLVDSQAREMSGGWSNNESCRTSR